MQVKCGRLIAAGEAWDRLFEVKYYQLVSIIVSSSYYTAITAML